MREGAGGPRGAAFVALRPPLDKVFGRPAGAGARSARIHSLPDAGPPSVSTPWRANDKIENLRPYVTERATGSSLTGRRVSARLLFVAGEKTSRREALERIGLTGAVLGGAALTTKLLYDHGGYGLSAPPGERQVRDFRLKGDPKLKMAIAKSSQQPEELVRRAVDALGGMKRFISNGDIVAVKPNIGWDRMPVHAANTNPRVVAEVVRLCFDAGAKQVIVTDASCNEPNRCFQKSGIWRATYNLGATVILPSAHRFRELRMKGDVLDLWPVYTPLVNADKVINVPVAKHHNLSKYTAAMKNWYGLLGGRRNRLHQNIDVSIADLATFMRPTLTIVDATRVLLRNGPQGGNIDDARDMHQVIASLDEVAVDAYGATLIGEKPENVRYLKLGHERGIGNMNWQEVPQIEV